MSGTQDTFSLSITLGNEAMSDNSDVARALRAVAEKLDTYETAGTVRDDNGNTVGRYEFVRSES